MTETRNAADFTCARCAKDANEGVHIKNLGARLKGQLAEPLADDDRLCASCHRALRIAYLESRLMVERGELTQLEIEAARKAAEHLVVATSTDLLLEREATRGQHVADAVARVGGSWPFVIGFGLLIVVWCAFNSLVLAKGAFDPYPYILLNLVLSCLAALQAPVIMMSQNRSGQRDRARADQDYQVNLKAELEVGSLHDKMDHLLHERWESLVEMQHAQLELIRELLERRSNVPTNDA